MCGFCGFAGNEINSNIIYGMMEKIAHRGPDSDGTYFDNDIAIGFRRLSIIGLNGGEQPIFNEDKSLVLVFNGEIYNYRDLQAELKSRGHIFSTQTDSECLLHLYEEYSSNMLHHLRGMFAFAIYDINKKTLFAARDFFGIKPFYYGSSGDTFFFGSEIKSFTAHPNFTPQLNLDALAQYLTFQYSVLPETFFKGIFKLPPGHYLTYKDGFFETHRYFQPKFSLKEMTLEKAVEDLDAVLGDSIQAHMVSDVEVGAFLSGGVDSSIVAARFNGQRCFTVGFDYENYSEIAYAKELAQQIGLEHHPKTITTEEYWDALPKVQYHMDEPLADPSATALYFVSQEAAKHVKVALSGEGADEFFGGYNIYMEPLDLRILTALPMVARRILGKMASFIPFNIKGKNFFIRGSKTIEERFIGNAFIFTKKEREKLLKQDTAKNPQDLTAPIYREVAAEGLSGDDITKMQHLDIQLWLVGDILLKADKMSMAHSLEVRVPFLDKEVFKVASQIPTNLRVNRSGTKYTFRRAALRHLPKISAGRRKLGFPVPIRLWLRDDKYYSIVKEYFTGDTAEKYFNVVALLKLLDDHKTKRRDNSRKIWTVFMFLLWHKQYFAV
ncbi:MAG: asparagine synthase (glutamine-hydrolyzing) [Defluviitaleaceae bacterium]|nr:asparagine synthase (glutamine-hydrolyzing) [Defluviitaleaceae bacterium]